MGISQPEEVFTVPSLCLQMCWDNGPWYVFGICAGEGAGRKPSVLEAWSH